MTSTRTVYPDAELSGSWEMTQPTAVDGSSYTEPGISSGGVFTYTAEDDAADGLQEDAFTIPAGAAADDWALLVTAVTDETDTGTVGTAPEVVGTNEVQTLSSDRTGGTFTLTHEGNTTGNLDAAAATASEVQTELEGLAHLTSGDVTVTGGPLTTDIVIEFTGTQAEQPITAITVTDSGTGGTAVAVAETTPGVSPVPFTLETDLNVPQAGDNFQPQMHVWRLKLTADEIGKNVRATFSDHDTNRSLGGALVIVDNLDGTTSVEVVGAEAAGNAGNVATFGAATPLTEGAKAIAILAKAKSGGAGVYYTSTDSPSAPAGMTGVAEALSDALTLTVWRSGILDTDSYTPGSSSWSQAALWASVVLIVKPATAASGGSGLAAAVDADDTTEWIDVSDAAGSMYEVLELDLSPLPADSIVTSGRVEIAHSCSVRNALRTTLVGINADDSISPCVEQEPGGYTPLPVGQVGYIQTASWSYTADGTPLSSFSRFGVALISSTAHPAVTDHRVFYVRARLEYDEGGPVVSNVAGPVSAGDPVTWTYSSDEGLGQSHYQVMVIAGSSQDPDAATVAANPLDPSTGEIVYDSGQTSGTLIRSVSVDDAPIGRGVCTVAVRAWATANNGQSVVSDWDTANFNLGGAVTTGTQSTDPVWNGSTGGVDVEVTVPAAVSRAWLLRSVDSGVSWVVAEDGPWTVTPSTVETLTDYSAPSLADTVRYQVTFDAGAMNETGAPEDVGGGGDVSTPGAAWWFRVPDTPDLNVSPFVNSFQISQPQRSVTAEQESGSVTTSTLPLAVTLTFTIWLRSTAEREAIAALINSGEQILVSDVWGRSWRARSTSGLQYTPRRSKGNLATSRPLRDLSTVEITLVGSEVAG